MGYVENILQWINYQAKIISDFFGFWGEQIAATGSLRSAKTSEELEHAWISLPPRQHTNKPILDAYNSLKASFEKKDKSAASAVLDALGMSVDQLVDTYMNIQAVPVDNALAAARNLVALDIGKDISIGSAAFVMESLSLGQVDNLAEFWKFVGRKTGYGGPITMLMKAPVELGVIRPLSYALQKQFRSTYISSGQAMALLTKDLITEAQARNALAYEGYSETLSDAILLDRFRELRLGELAWAFNDADIDDAWLLKRLQYARYAPEDQQRILKMLKDKFMYSYRNAVAAQLRNQYKEGYISAKDFRLKLFGLGLPTKVIDLKIQEAEALFLIDHNADLVAAWTTAFRNDILNEDDLRAHLSTIIADPARVEAKVYAAKVARKPAKSAAPKPMTQGVRVSSKPSWSQISLDERDTGRLTPDTIETTAGRHSITISADGFADAVFDVQVQEGQFLEIYAPLEKLE